MRKLIVSTQGTYAYIARAKFACLRVLRPFALKTGRE